MEMKTETGKKERVFSIELTSKSHLKNVTLTNGTNESVLVEGTIGTLVHATFEEGIVLEVTGSKGTMRLDLRADEIKKATKNRIEASKQ
jgi:hypothetical protein